MQRSCVFLSYSRIVYCQGSDEEAEFPLRYRIVMSRRQPSPELVSSQMLPKLLIAVPPMSFGAHNMNALCLDVTCFVGHHYMVRCTCSIHILQSSVICWQFAPCVSTECKMSACLVQLDFTAGVVAKMHLATSNGAQSTAQQKARAVAWNRTVCANPASITTDRRACLASQAGTNKACPTSCRVAQYVRIRQTAWQVPRH